MLNTRSTLGRLLSASLLAGIAVASTGCITKSGDPLDEIVQAQRNEATYQRIREISEEKEKRERVLRDARERQARAARNFSRKSQVIYGNEGGGGGGGGGD